MIFKTRELWMAAALELEGYPVIEIEVNRGQGTFHINVGDLDTYQWQKDYLDGAVTASVVTLHEKVKELAKRIKKIENIER